MSKGKFLSKLSFFKKKKRTSRETLRSNSTSSYHNYNNDMEVIPEIVRGNTVPAPSTSREANLYSNKRKNISHSSVEDLDKKKKQPYLGLDKASTSECPIPTPAPSATTSSANHNIFSNNSSISIPQINNKEKNVSSSPVSVCDKEECVKEEVLASTSNSYKNDSNDINNNAIASSSNTIITNDAIASSSNNVTTNNDDDKIEVKEEKSEKNIPKVFISKADDKAGPSSSNGNQIKINNLDTPPYTPTIFVTSKSTISSIDGNNQVTDTVSQDTNGNEVKSHIDEFDLYVEDIFNKLILDSGLSPEAETEESPDRYNRDATEHFADHLTTESLTPIPSNSNIINIQQQSHPSQLSQELQISEESEESQISQQPKPQIISSNLNSTTPSNVIPSETIPIANNTINNTNENTKKETFNNDTSLKKNNEPKKDKKIDDDSNSRDKENKTNDNKAKNNNMEKYLEKETTHSIVESMGVLNNTIEMLKCGICLDILLDPKIVEPCGHSFCNHCLRLLQTRVCPLCRTRIHDYHSSILLNELSELIAKYSLSQEQLEERNQCCHEIEEKDKHLNDECMRLMELMELAHQPDNSNNYSVQFHELVELNETDDDI